MNNNVKTKLKIGFTICRIGIDLCWSALLIAVSFILLFFFNKNINLINCLFLALGFVIVGLIMFVVGRTMVGIQSRKLNFKSDASQEERAFADAMLALESDASDTNLLSSVSRMTSSGADDIVAGAASSRVIGGYFAIGKGYMGSNVFVNRIGLIVGVAVTIVLLFANI